MGSIPTGSTREACDAVYEVGKQKETRGAHNEMCASPPDRLSCLCSEIKGDRIFQSLGPAYDRTEARRPEEIIAYTMLARRTRFGSEVSLGIGKVDDCRTWCVVNIERACREELEKVPRSPERYGRRLGSHQTFQLGRRNTLSSR